MKAIHFFFFLFLVHSLDTPAQPGSIEVSGNLNDIDSNQIKSCFQIPMCSLGAIVIDTATNLDRLHHLSHTSNLRLFIELDSLPLAFLTINFKHLKTLVIYAPYLKTLSNIPKMDSLKTLHITAKKLIKISSTLNLPNLQQLIISRFSQPTLAIEGKLPNLKTLELKYSDQLIQIKNTSILSKLVTLKIHACKKLTIDNLPLYQLKYLAFSGVRLRAQFMWEDIVRYPHLEKIILHHIRFTSLPSNFPKKLNYISISNSTTNLETLHKLSQLKNIRQLELRDIDLSFKK